MKKLFLLTTFISALAFSGYTQEAKPVKKVLELKIPREGGANAASVAWHPIQKKYYAAMAGNVAFCLAVYDATGKLLSDVNQEALFDVRGLWYNPGTKTLQMNGYNDFGWGEYKLNDNGIPVDVGMLHEYMNQSTKQSAGSYDPLRDVLYFFNAKGNIDKYNYEDATFKESIPLHLGATTKAEIVENETIVDQYNTSSALYTSIAGAEIALLNYDKLEIELYNIATGYLTRRLKLPSDTKIPDSHWLNFAYCNGLFWLFDTDTRIWMGFK